MQGRCKKSRGSWESMSRCRQARNQEAEEEAEGDAAEGQMVVTHFQQDPTLADPMPQQATAVLMSVNALMAKKLERKQEREKEKEPK